MTTTAQTFLTRLATLLVAILFAATIGGCATKRSQAQEQPQGWSRAELEQLLAPVALYPDALLAQLLIAATYPDEIIEAAAWSRRHPTLVGEDAVRAADHIDWDPSIKSLLAFPDLLARMDERIDWTRALGEAFLAEEESVIEAVQALRRRARVEGSLASDGRVRVVEDGPRIHVAFASPALVTLPYYDPRVVYGRWWWPAHPPAVWAPWPGDRRVAGVRLSVGFFFGGIDWPRRQVHVVRTDPWYVHSAIVRRAPHRTVVIAPGRWRHERTRRHVQRPEAPAIKRERTRSDRRRVDDARKRPQAATRPTPAREARRSEVQRTKADAVQHERTRPKPRAERKMSRVATRPAPPHQTRQTEVQRSKAGAAQRERRRKNPRHIDKAGEQPRMTAKGALRREVKRSEPKREARHPKPQREVKRSKPKREAQRMQPQPETPRPEAKREAKPPEPQREAQKRDRGPDADTPPRRPGARAAQRRGPRSAPERRPQDADEARQRRPQG